jgi:hypothetical protein
VVCVTAIDSDLQVTTEMGELRVLLSFVPLFLWQDQDPSADRRTRPAISHTTGLRPGCVRAAYAVGIIPASHASL